MFKVFNNLKPAYLLRIRTANQDFRRGLQFWGIQENFDVYCKTFGQFCKANLAHVV